MPKVVKPMNNNKGSGLVLGPASSARQKKLYNKELTWIVTEEFAPRLLSSDAGDVDEKRLWLLNDCSELRTDAPPPLPTPSCRLMPTPPGETKNQEKH